MSNTRARDRAIRKSRTSARARGLSLVEVIMALVVIGLAAPALLVQVSAGARQQAVGVIQENLVQLTSARLGEIMADAANPTRGYTFIQATAYPAETTAGGLAGYSRQTEIREVSSADFITAQPSSGIKRLRITVTGPQGRTLSIESFVTDLSSTTGGGAGG